MKRLLSLVGILALAASLLPSAGMAGYRGAFDPITWDGGATDINGVHYNNGLANGMQTPAIRYLPTRGPIDGLASVNRQLCFTTRSQVVGQETSREIWLSVVKSRAGLFGGTSEDEVREVRKALLVDPTGVVSYADPAWSRDGRYLAYVVTNSPVTESAIYVQEYSLNTYLPDVAPIGAPILVVPAVGTTHNRHPYWSPDGTSLAFDSDVSGTSIDLYTVTVFPSVGTPVRRTFNAAKGEQNPAWSPDGSKLAFDTNAFGPSIIEILDLASGSVTPAETNFRLITHANPDWSSNGQSIFYEAPENEDLQANTDIWKLDLATQAKCDILFDGNGDGNVAVSQITLNTRDGIPYNNFYMESQGGGFGLIIWRSNPINSCIPALPLGIDISPNTLNIDDPTPGERIKADITMPPEVLALGYQATFLNGPGEGLRVRLDPFPSPTMMGLTAKAVDCCSANWGLPEFGEHNGVLTVNWDRRAVQAKLTALGLFNQQVPVEVKAYSNITGRSFRGFGYVTLRTSLLSASKVVLEQNAPNPFNPNTKINFSVSKPSDVALRVYNVRGELVKTLVDQHFEAGNHSVSWDGRNAAGSHVSSGIYYAKVTTRDGSTDLIKMVMEK